VDQDSSTAAHREFEDMLSAAALGTLDRDEHTNLMEHLRTCAVCRAQLGGLVFAAESLPLAVEARAPSDELRARLRAQVTGGHAPLEAPSEQAPAQARGAPVLLPLDPRHRSKEVRGRGGGFPFWLAAAAAMLLVGLLGGVLIDRLLLDRDDSDRVQVLALHSPTGLEIEGSQLVYLEDEGIIRFYGPDLPAPPEDQVYQVWLIAGDDQPPTPVGVIDPVTGEFATTADPQRYAVFAVTVEPGPLGSSAPTSEPVIVAELPEPSAG
jgi:hypothetical protein